jgi:hypothetical protein
MTITEISSRAVKSAVDMPEGMLYSYAELETFIYEIDK